jgi:hypothetical protein
MATCNLITSNIISTCEALQAAGGTQDFMYVLENREDLTSPTYTSPDGALSGFTLTSPAKLIKVTGKRLQNSALAKVVKSDDRKTFFNHEVKFAVYATEALEMGVLQQLAKIQKGVVFLPLNNNTILVYGFDFGMQCTDMEANTGTKIEDGTGKMFTFSDIQLTTPLEFFLTSYSASITYLNGKIYA